MGSTQCVDMNFSRLRGKSQVEKALLVRYSAERLVQRDYRHIYVPFALSDGIFCLKLGALGIEQLEKIDYTFAVAQAGDVRGTFALAGLIIELDQLSLLRVVVRQGIVRLFQRAENSVFIGCQCLFGCGA